MTLTVTILYPIIMLLCGLYFKAFDAFDSRIVVTASAINTVLSVLNALQKLGRVISGVEISQIERIVLIIASLMWISAVFLHAYIFIKGIKNWKDIKK